VINTADFAKAHKILKAAKTIAVVGHIRPDGDAVGSALAIKYAYETTGAVVDIFFEEDIPNQFPYLEGHDTFQSAYPEERKGYDAIVIVDLGETKRMGIFEPLLKISKSAICIDHHLGFAFKCDVALSDPTAAATGELVFQLFETQKVPITKKIADALYTAVATDTGCFLHSSTTAQTHRIAASLVEYGCDKFGINQVNFLTYDTQLFVGLGQILKNIRFYLRGSLSVTKLKDAKDYNTAHKGKYKQYLSGMEDVMISALLMEQGKKRFNVSFRSHGTTDVSEIAASFGGGGHRNAAGCTLRGSYRKLRKQIVREVEKRLS